MDIQWISMYLLSASALKGSKELLLDSAVMAAVLPEPWKGVTFLLHEMRAEL